MSCIVDCSNEMRTEPEYQYISKSGKEVMFTWDTREILNNADKKLPIKCTSFCTRCGRDFDEEISYDVFVERVS